MTNITNEELRLLRCPITRHPLIKVATSVIDQANGMIHGGQLTNRVGEIIDDVLDDGLIDEAGTWLYSIRDGILCLLADEAVSLSRFNIQHDVANA